MTSSAATKQNIRDYGLGDCQEAGIPRLKELVEHECPNCKCQNLAIIEVAVKDKRLSSGVGKGTYYSCVACPWASPMISTAVK
jgi:hypothetical protein